LSIGLDHATLTRRLGAAAPPLLVGRLGTGEIIVVNDRDKTVASRHVGVSPPTEKVMAEFSAEYISATEATDIMAVFNAPWFPSERTWTCSHNLKPELEYVSADVFADKGDVFELFADSSSWIHALAGQRILIVSPYKTSIQRQYDEKRHDLFPNSTYPEFASLRIVQAPMTQCMPGDPQSSVTWTDHLETMKRETQNGNPFDVALLGCGGYAMPLAHFIKSTCKKKAIVTGGVLQTYFGIIGKRWESRWESLNSPIPTASWTRPLSHERPRCWQQIESGCYW
jgi:hypothetical protein